MEPWQHVILKAPTITNMQVQIHSESKTLTDTPFHRSRIKVVVGIFFGFSVEWSVGLYTR